MQDILDDLIATEEYLFEGPEDDELDQLLPAMCCDVCGFEFPSTEGLPEDIAEMLNEISTCAKCTRVQFEALLKEEEDSNGS